MLIFLLLLLPLLAYGQDWSYDPSSPSGPSNWKEKYPSCGGQNQSPIKITTSDTELDTSDYQFYSTQLYLYNGQQRLRHATLENIGNAVRINLKEKHYVSFYTRRGGSLPGLYRVHEAIFNWPAEHIIDGAQSKLELQIVTWNVELYKTYEDAVGKPDGRAIFSVLFSVVDREYNNNPAFQTLNETLYSIPNPGDKAEITGNDLELVDVVPDLRRNRYYRYKGSFSSPACDEDIIRIVFADTITISNSQFEAFRSLIGSDGRPTLDGRSRPVQSLNERKVKRSFELRWVFNPDDPVDPFKKSCTNIFWVIDQSCSVYEQMDRVKQMLLDVTDRVIIGNNSVLMTLLKFDENPYYNFYARDTTNNEVTKKLLNEKPIGQTEICETRTFRALFELETRFFTTRHMRHRYGVRQLPRSKDIVFIITDGRTFPYAGRWPAIYKAEEIAHTGADIYAIKLDNKWGKEGETEIYGFVGGKMERQIHINDTDLVKMVSSVINHYKPCEENTTTTAKPTTTTTTGPPTEPVTGATTPSKPAPTTTTTVPTTTTVHPCNQDLNLVLVFDTTQSLNKGKDEEEAEKTYKKRINTSISALLLVHDFTSHILKEYDISNDATRVAVVTFDEHVHVVQYLNETKSYKHTSDSINNKAQNWTGAGTRTDKALKRVYDEVLTVKYGWRSEIPTLVLLATDGNTFPCCGKCCRKWDYPEDECTARSKLDHCVTTKESKDKLKKWAGGIAKDYGDKIQDDKHSDFIILSVPNANPTNKKTNETMDFYGTLVKNFEKDVIRITDLSELELGAHVVATKIKKRICETPKVFAQAMMSRSAKGRLPNVKIPPLDITK